LTVTTASGGSVVLEWQDNSTNETGFFIERATSPTGTYKRIATIVSSTKTRRGTGKRSYTNTGLVAGTTYYYRVIAVNTSGVSSFTSARGTTRSA
jgi:predicted phage tail protein